MFYILQLILIFFFTPTPAFGEELVQKIYITEIGAHEKSNYEWIEIYNNSEEDVDLTDWKFYENETNHKLSSDESLLIPSKTYAIIADVPKNFLENHPEYKGILIDSAWQTLKESGEEIGLKDENDDFIEKFIYPEVTDTSLQRIDLSDNWQDHGSSDSAGFANVFENEDATTPEEEPKDTQNLETTSEKQPLRVTLDSQDIIINEFLVDPLSGDPEWIEFYNTTSETISLDGMGISDESKRTYSIKGSIKSHEYFVHEFSSAVLNNNGDSIKLKIKDPLFIVDQVAYGQDTLLNTLPEEGMTYARSSDGSWKLTTTATKGEKNIITQEVVIDGPIPSHTTSQSPIQFNEVYSNPIGSDRFYEFIEIKNVSDKPVDLKDWVIKDDEELRVVFPKNVLFPGDIKAFNRKDTKIVLENDGDSLVLLNPDNAIVDHVQIPALEEHHSYQKIDGQWKISAQPTKGTINEYITTATQPVLSMNCNKEVYLSEIITCDGSDSYDPQYQPITLTWELHNSSKTKSEFLYDDIVSFTPTEFDQKYITLIVSDGVHQKSQTLEIIYKDSVQEPIVTTASVKKDPPKIKRSITTKLPPTPEEPEEIAPEKQEYIEPDVVALKTNNETQQLPIIFVAVGLFIVIAISVYARIRSRPKAPLHSARQSGSKPNINK